LREALVCADRQPQNLAAAYQAWSKQPHTIRRAPPTLAFAAIGQARADGQITPELETKAIGNLLTDWAVRSTLDIARQCAVTIGPASNLKMLPVI
jgi:hypothetical protein